MADLGRAYRGTSKPAVYIDESFRLQGETRYYIMSAAMVDADQRVRTRRALLDYYGGSIMHASEMFRRAELRSIRGAAELVSRQTDARDIVVHTPVRTGDPRGAAARAACLKHLFLTLHHDFEVTLFVIDARKTPDENEEDRRVLAELRRDGRLPRNAMAVHCRPSEEPLLALADIIAWTYRQSFARNDGSWFEPLREHTHITRLS